MDNFEKELMHQFRRGQRMFWFVFVISSLVSLGVLGGIIFVAWHFLSKIW